VGNFPLRESLLEIEVAKRVFVELILDPFAGANVSKASLPGHRTLLVNDTWAFLVLTPS
jgi:hypothetical protein